MDARTKIVFEIEDIDSQTGATTWVIRLETDGVTDVVGRIEKSVTWCGVGYRAEDYSVYMEAPPGDDPDVVEEEEEASFEVANAWTGGRGMTARQALAACKAFARRVLKERGVL